MLRSLFSLLVVAVVGTSQGCRICDSPYDYCGPVMPCGESCGHGGYVGGGYGDGGCATCNGGGRVIEHSRQYESGTVIQGQPTPAPEPAIMPQQGRRPANKTAAKATYEAPLQSVRTPYPAHQSPRTAKSSGPIFW